MNREKDPEILYYYMFSCMCGNSLANSKMCFFVVVVVVVVVVVFQGVYHTGIVAVCFEAIQMKMRRINSTQPLLCVLKGHAEDHQCDLAALMKVKNESLQTNLQLEPEAALTKKKKTTRK